MYLWLERQAKFNHVLQPLLRQIANWAENAAYSPSTFNSSVKVRVWSTYTATKSVRK